MSPAPFISVDGDGYEFMNTNAALGWRRIADWGVDGYDLGRWPLVVVMVSDEYDKPNMLVYIEGDVDVREFPNVAERTEHLNAVAESFWRSGVADGPNDIAAYPAGALPANYRGPSQPTMHAAVTSAPQVAVPVLTQAHGPQR